MADSGREDQHDSVLSFINSEFSEDIKDLVKAKNLYEQVKRENDEIRLQVSLVSSEAPGKIDCALNQAKDALLQAKVLSSDRDRLHEQSNEHSVLMEPKVKQLTELTEQVDELERYVSYLEWIARLEELSSNIQTALIINSVERAAGHFAEMAQLMENLQASHCLNLIKFAQDTIMFWYKILKNKLVSEFEEILTALGWPFVSATVMPPSAQDVAEYKDRMKVLFGQLVKLQLPDGMAPDSQINHPLLAQIPGWKPILMPIQLLIKPLKKRFHYHFFGNKQTNSIDKPEWFFTQILSWIRDHRDFLRTTIQPMMREANLGHIDCQVEFIRGLLVLVIERMATDIPDLLYDEHQYSHLIDEALAFDKELHFSYNYPQNQPRCLHVLTEKEAFDKWIMIERKFALEKMDAMLSSPTAWQSQYKDIPDVDELKIPECGEAFMTLMLTITERYKSLPSAAHRIKFMDLQLELFDDFRIRLLQVMKEVASTPTSNVFCAIFNSVNYIIDVAKQWNELPFFIQLQYYRCAPLVSQYATPMAGSPRSPLSPDKDISSPLTPAKSIMQISMEFDESLLDKIEGTVFDNTIKLYEHIKFDMMKNIVSDVMMDVKARSRPYRRERWICLASQKDLVATGLSSSACEMFMVLRDWLHAVQQLLSKGLFRIFWQNLAEDLNRFIYKEIYCCWLLQEESLAHFKSRKALAVPTFRVILDNNFNDGGSTQLQYDMTRNLFPLFGPYTAKPENYFKDVKEALIILNLKAGSAMLLKEVLNTALHVALIDPHVHVQDPIAALHEAGVYKLSPEDVELLLSLRTDLA